MSGYPFQNGWGTGRMPFPPPGPPFPSPMPFVNSPNFLGPPINNVPNEGVPRFPTNFGPPPNIFRPPMGMDPQFYARFPPSMPTNSFPSVVLGGMNDFNPVHMHSQNAPFERQSIGQGGSIPFSNQPPFQPSQICSAQSTVIPPSIQSVQDVSQLQPVVEVKFLSEKEKNLEEFLQSRVLPKNKSVKVKLSTVQFCSTFKRAFSIMKLLSNYKRNLSLNLECDENQWNTEMEKVKELKKELDSLCCFVSSSENLNALKKIIQVQSKRRASKRKQKQELSLQKVRTQESLHLKIGQWLDEIKEKNEKLKRDAELKREADNILSEVRRKILEAKRVTESLNVFEKLRAARKAYAEQIGLELSEEHEIKFVDTMASIRCCFANQLVQYEGEEHALKVMLEAEQEEHREEEGRRRLETAKSLLRLRQDAIRQALFGHETAEPAAGHPLFLFYQHQNLANCSIDALVQIRRHWDSYATEEGEPVPHQWVVPLPPSNASWEKVLEAT